MQFSSFTDFINMGGYAFYVWLSYGVSTALIIYLLLSSVSRHKAVLQQISLRQKRELRLRQAAEQNIQEQGLTQPELNDEIIDQMVINATANASVDVANKTINESK